MTFAAIVAFLEMHGSIVLAAWLVLEQIIAANPKWKSNSTLEAIVNVGKKFLGRYKKP